MYFTSPKNYHRAQYFLCSNVGSVPFFFCKFDVIWHVAIGSNDANHGRVIFPPGALLIFVVVDAFFRCAHRSSTLLAHSYQLLALGKLSFLRFYPQTFNKMRELVHIQGNPYFFNSIQISIS